jgi:MFS family permease
MGDKLMLVGMTWVLSERFSPQWVPWFVAAGAMPHLLSIRFAGPGIARLGGPLRTVIVTDVARAILFAAGALGVAGHVGGAPLLALLFALAIVSNGLGALFNPAIFSLPAELARGDLALLQKTTALVESCFSLSAVVAPLLSTLLYKWTGLAGLLLVNGASYGLAAWLEAGIRAERAPEAGKEDRDAAPAVTALQALREDPALGRLLAGFFILNLFMGPVLAFLPLYASGVYGGTIDTLAWLEGAMGAGTAVGTLALAAWSLPGSVRGKATWAMAAQAACYLLFARSRGLATGAAAIGGLGLALAVVNVVLLNLFQTRPRPEAVPAVMGWVNLISVASLPFSMTIVGAVLARAQVREVAEACAAVFALLVALTAIFGRELRARPDPVVSS